MTHLEEHQILHAKIGEASTAAQRLYEDYHNGDKKLNKQIMAIRDSLNDATVSMESHIARTGKDDQKLEWHGYYQKLIWIMLAALVGALIHRYVM